MNYHNFCHQQKTNLVVKNKGVFRKLIQEQLRVCQYCVNKSKISKVMQHKLYQNHSYSQEQQYCQDIEQLIRARKNESVAQIINQSIFDNNTNEYLTQYYSRQESIKFLREITEYYPFYCVDLQFLKDMPRFFQRKLFILYWEYHQARRIQYLKTLKSEIESQGSIQYCKDPYLSILDNDSQYNSSQLQIISKKSRYYLDHHEISEPKSKLKLLDVVIRQLSQSNRRHIKSKQNSRKSYYSPGETQRTKTTLSPYQTKNGWNTRKHKYQ